MYKLRNEVREFNNHIYKVKVVNKDHACKKCSLSYGTHCFDSEMILGRCLNSRKNLMYILNIYDTKKK